MSAFKVFPCGANKAPLFKGWQAAATSDPETIAAWANLYREQLKWWGVPCGAANGILALDVDKKTNGFESLKNLELPKTMFQNTPSGGCHYLFKYPNDGNRYGNPVGFLPGLDARGEGGYICWYGANGFPTADPPLWLLKGTIKSAFNPDPTLSNVKVSQEIAMAMVQKSLEAIREASPGESNNTLNVESFRLGQLIASGSLTREYTEGALLRAALERGKPQYEAMATIKSGLNGGGAKPLISPFGASAPVSSFPLPGPTTRYTPERFTRDHLLDISKLRKPQLFEHWSTQDIHITTADGGTGKTTLKLFEAICLALGERFLGFQCLNPGKTLFITGEDSAPKLGAMIGQIVRQMGFFEHISHTEKINTILASVIVKKDADLCIISKDKLNFLSPSSIAMTRVMEAVEDHEPRMIVFDPISCFWGSEMALNDMNKAVTKFMSELAERSGACVEMINHMGKQASANKDMSQFAGRGGSGLVSNSRVCRVLQSLTDTEYTEYTGESLTDKQSAMLCNVNKFTDGSPLYNKPFLILRDGFLFSRKTMLDSKAKQVESELGDIERVFGFIKECRTANKYASEKVVVAHFMFCGNPISGERVKRALNLLCFQGHMGEKLKPIENPDQTERGQVFVVTDLAGNE